MKKTMLAWIIIALIISLTSCSATDSENNENATVKVYGDGSYSSSLEEKADIIVIVSNGSNKNTVKMTGTLNGTEIFSGKYSKEKTVLKNGGFTSEDQIAYYYISTEDEEYKFLVEAGKSFTEETVTPENGECIWIFFSYYNNSTDGEGIAVNISNTPMAFA